MRRCILVRRDSALGSYLIGEEACRILASIEGVSAAIVDREYINRADLSYESSDSDRLCEQIDQVLRERGMRRV